MPVLTEPHWNFSSEAPWIAGGLASLLACLGGVAGAFPVARCAWNQLSSHIALARRHLEHSMSKRFVKFRDDADRKRFRAALADIVRCAPTPSREGAGSQRRLSQLGLLRVWFASGDPIVEGILLDGKPVGAQAFKEANAEAMENQMCRLAAMPPAGIDCFRYCAPVPWTYVCLSLVCVRRNCDRS